MPIILFDTSSRAKLFPLSLTRAIADLRVGILSIKEWWECSLKQKAFVYTDQYLQDIYEPILPGEYLLIDACILPSQEILNRILKLQLNESLSDSDGLVAGKIKVDQLPSFRVHLNSLFPKTTSIEKVDRFESAFSLFQRNDKTLRQHYSLITEGRISQPIPETVQVINPENIFIEEGAQLNFCTLNASNGPVYIGKNAIIMEGSTIRGPFAMCEGAVVKMGSKIYGSSTLGPYCVGGGEIKNSILMGYSNKAHDGYLGDSVIGEWCNIGAGTSNSNIKNTASEVKVLDYYTNSYITSGTKCGLVMGDYSRTAINTSINTGTTIGVCCNVFGEGLTPKIIPDFSWGTKGLMRYDFDKAIKDIGNWKSMKNKNLDESKLKVLRHIFEHNND